jgi:diguanylate cyclase (GGDEF)-like protein
MATLTLKPIQDPATTATAPQASRSQFSEALRIGERQVQIVSVPMRDANGEGAAWLYAMIDLELLNPMLQADELGATSTVLLVDRDLRFLNPPPGINSEARYNGAEANLTSSVAYYDDPLGMRVVGTRRLFPRFGWTLVIEQPYDEAFAPIVSSISRVAGLNFAIVLAVGLVALRIANSIVRPLHALSDGAKRLSQGEREVEIDERIFSSDEVRVLTRAFNEMSRGLGRNARELEENQEEIEAANVELVTKNEELSNMNLVLEQLSITDGLTKLHNHRYFQDSITAECRRSSRTADPLCLILIDIDFFKKWNDRLGHAGGDEILRRMAEILNESVRETDLLARYGGEEFALLAINTTLLGAAALGEKVRQAVEETDFVTDVPSERDQLTVSVGVAVYGGDRMQLFADADSALYAAKDAGRNQVIVAPPSTDGSEIPEVECPPEADLD